MVGQKYTDVSEYRIQEKAACILLVYCLASTLKLEVVVNSETSIGLRGVTSHLHIRHQQENSVQMHKA
jgi:hypothetical protein